LDLIDYRGSGQVEGHLGWDQNRKSFRFGEQNGYLRVITFSGLAPPSGTTVSPATLSARSPILAPASTSEPNIANDRSVLAGDQVHYLRDAEFMSAAW
jgi:hypothetical protein